ncbi:vacuolar ATPase assembly integral membrane protein vma21 [Vanrija albida]|uniref:Vacuolar ATPase assembly integral membrane protein vma21 n=1 Tax=Vanrija albida TaxID=181172 RepID=A0ABR3QEV0_9TREE
MPASGKMAAPPAAQAHGIPQDVLLKLFTFAVLMAIVPISTYFLTVKHLWNGNTAYAALSAVLAANIVLGGYVYLAFVEDASNKAEVQEKKAQ